VKSQQKRRQIDLPAGSTASKGCALPISRKKDAAVGNDSAGVGNDTPTCSESRRPIIERSMSGTELRVSNQATPDGEPIVICETQGAMSQQCSDAAHVNESVPQKLLQLVGYRDPNACPASWHPPRRTGTG
jgi:hypothetical protein